MMPIALYTETSPESAIAALGQQTSAQHFLGGSFVVLERAVLCFLTAGAAGSAQIETPRRIRWRGDDSSGDRSDLTWWPSAVVDVYDWSGPTVKKLRDHHLFLRDDRGAAFFYAGTAHLVSYGTDRIANFELTAALPRPLWLRLGGYSGWLLELEHDRRNISDGDETVLTAALTEFASRESSHVVLTRYEDDALHVYKNERCAWLMYLREPADPGLYIDSNAASTEAPDERFRCECGIDVEHPSRQTVPLTEAFEIIRFFFRNGALPTLWSWAG